MSTDGGSTRSDVTPPPITNDIRAVTVSGDGSFMAVTEEYGTIYSSNDDGQNWNTLTIPSTGWHFIDSSENGKSLVAARWYNTAPEPGGGVYHSDDYGQTWYRATDEDGNLLVATSKIRGIGITADGKKVIALYIYNNYGGLIYVLDRSFEYEYGSLASGSGDSVGKAKMCTLVQKDFKPVRKHHTKRWTRRGMYR